MRALVVAQAHAVAAAVLLAGACMPAHSRAGYLARDDVQQFIDAMVASHGFERARLERWLRDARYSAMVERLMQPPIPFAQRNWLEYRNRYIEPTRIDAGIAFWYAQRVALARAEDQFGVPAERFEQYAQKRWGKGWKLAAGGRKRALDDVTAFAEDAAGFQAKVTAEIEVFS